MEGVHAANVDQMDALQVEAMLFGVAEPQGAEIPTRFCRICLEGEVDACDRLLSPCRCKGTVQYVHASCLDRWRVFSTRMHSAVRCDQCATEYRFKPTVWMRVLTSRALLFAASVVLFLVAVWLTGLLGGQMMGRYQPELFQETHPYVVQTASYQPTPEHVPHRLRMLVSEQRMSYESASSLSSFWEYMLGPADDDKWTDDDLAEAETNAHMYSLGIFQPSVLVQLVQGMLQRMLELATGRIPFRDAPHLFVLRHTSTTHVGLGEGAFAPPVRFALTHSERLLWHVSLGLALLGITSVFNVLLAASIVGPFRLGAPFSVVGYSVHPAASGALAHARIVWESVNIPGMLLLVAVLWGIVRTYLLFYRSVHMSARLFLAHMPMSIIDYDDRQPALGLTHLPEADADELQAAPLHAAAYGVVWGTRLARAAAGPAFGMNNPFSAWVLARVGM